MYVNYISTLVEIVKKNTNKKLLQGFVYSVQQLHSNLYSIWKFHTDLPNIYYKCYKKHNDIV